MSPNALPCSSPQQVVRTLSPSLCEEGYSLEQHLQMGELLQNVDLIHTRMRIGAQALHDDVHAKVDAHLKKLLCEANARIEADMAGIVKEAETAVKTAMKAAGTKVQELQQRLAHLESENSKLRRSGNQAPAAIPEQSAWSPKPSTSKPTDEPAPSPASLDDNHRLISIAEAAAFSRRLQRVDTLSRAEMRNAGRQLEWQAKAIQDLKQELEKARAPKTTSEEPADSVDEGNPSNTRLPRMEPRSSTIPEREESDEDAWQQEEEEVCEPSSPVRIVDCSTKVTETASACSIRSGPVLQARLLKDAAGSAAASSPLSGSSVAACGSSPTGMYLLSSPTRLLNQGGKGLTSHERPLPTPASSGMARAV